MRVLIGVKSFAAGVMAGSIAAVSLSVFAAPAYEQVSAYSNAIRVVVDGKELEDYTTLLYEDWSYLPLRKIAEALGADVSWNHVTRTADIKLRVPPPEVVTEKEIVYRDPDVKEVIKEKEVEVEVEVEKEVIVEIPVIPSNLEPLELGAPGDGKVTGEVKLSEAEQNYLQSFGGLVSAMAANTTEVVSTLDSIIRRMSRGNFESDGGRFIYELSIAQRKALLTASETDGQLADMEVPSGFGGIHKYARALSSEMGKLLSLAQDTSTEDRIKFTGEYLELRAKIIETAENLNIEAYALMQAENISVGSDWHMPVYRWFE